MHRTATKALLAALLGLAVAGGSRADELLYSWDAGVPPHDPSAGWDTIYACEPPCAESIVDGHYVLTWNDPPHRGQVNYFLRIADIGAAPPPPFWVEWRFRSNHPLGDIFFGCDHWLSVNYPSVIDGVYVYGDAVISISGQHFVADLALDEFHTYRFETSDGINYGFSVDGRTFFTSAAPSIQEFVTALKLIYYGGCNGDTFAGARNETDYVRYGHGDTGEQMIAADPALGTLSGADGMHFRSFTITFDAPTFLFIDDISVSATGGAAPGIAATRRLDNGPPEVLEVVLDGPIPPGETTTFTFDTGTGPQSIAYFREQPEIPATSTWGLAVATALGVGAGAAVFQRGHTRLA